MIVIKLLDKETGKFSKPVSIDEVIFHQNDIEFQWGKYPDDDYATLPYKDFLFFQDDYTVLLDLVGDDNETT